MAHGVLDERPYYAARRASYARLDSDEDEPQWEREYRAWSVELEDDLDARCLLLPRDFGDNTGWGDVMGWREATLRDEANRLWQQERRELLQEGWDFESVRARLTDSFYLWLDTPQDKLDDGTPRDVILEEQRSAPREEADDEDDES
jgi:hypothetical protein